MKCKHCGGEVGLEQRFCPYCGKPNEEAMKHVEEMEKIQSSYKKTEEKVVASTNKYVGLTVRLAVLLLLVIGTVITSVIKENAYSFPSDNRRKEALRNSKQHSEILRQYLQDGDYIGFEEYLGYHNIPAYLDQYAEFDEIENCTACYLRCIQNFEEVVMTYEDDNWLDSACEKIGYNLTYFYKECEKQKKEENAQAYKACIDDMVEQMNTAVYIYLGLDEEELQEFLEWKKLEQAEYVEGVIRGAE